MAAPLTDGDKFLLLGAVGDPATRDRISALLDLAGTGDVSGPGASTDNALVRFDGATGDVVQNSGVIVSDANAMSGVASLNGVTSAEIGHLSGVTSPIQTQLSGKVNDTGDTLTGALLFPNGTAGSPSISFAAPFNTTGIYKSGGGAEWSVSVAGGQKLLIDSGSIYAIGTTNFEMLGSGVIRNSSGSGAVPSYTFASDSDTGLSNPTPNALSLICGGSAKLQVFGPSGNMLLGTTSQIIIQDMLVVGSLPAVNNVVRATSNDGSLFLSGGDGATINVGGGSDAHIVLYGSAHASRPSVISFETTGTTQGEINGSGRWLIGSSGGTQIHQVRGDLSVTGLTASRALQTDGSQNLVSSAVTSTELGYVSGVTSAIQTQLDNKQAAVVSTARAECTTGTVITSSDTTIVFDSEIYDSSGAYNPATGEFTVPSNGKYRVTASIDANSTAFTINDRIILKVFKNGSVNTFIGFITIQATNTFNMGLNGSATLSCTAGDILTVRGISTTSITLNGETPRNYVCIEKVSS